MHDYRYNYLNRLVVVCCERRTTIDGTNTSKFYVRIMGVRRGCRCILYNYLHSYLMFKWIQVRRIPTYIICEHTAMLHLLQLENVIEKKNTK